MLQSIRLQAIPEPADRRVRFVAEFSAPEDSTSIHCAPAYLDTGDGTTLELGELCQPTPVTWRAQRSLELASHTYSAAGPFSAQLHWGQVTVSTAVDLTAAPQPPQVKRPQVTQLQVTPESKTPLAVVVTVEVQGLLPEQRLRVDAGAGQVRWLTGQDGASQSIKWSIAYAKPGAYKVAVDLLDDKGFWLATLAESPLEVTPPKEAIPVAGPVTEVPLPAPAPLTEVMPAQATNPPWIPFRYVRPVWGWAQTYKTPGGSTVSRTLVPGTYLAIQEETLVDGNLWYQSTYGDWIAASAVAVIQPSELRGVELERPAEPPPPPPGEVRHGIVTAYRLNVRAQPGVRPDNPPIDQLTQGTEVTIYEEQRYAGDVWYRIGEGRWVHSGWVRLIDETQPPPQPTRRGIVTAYRLNVRARPGVRPDNPPVDQLVRGTIVSIFEEEPYAGAIWYRIGTDRWVHSGWVRLLDSSSARSDRALSAVGETGAALPVGWVVSSTLNVRAQPGVRPDNPPIDEVYHNQSLSILEARTVDGATWYRIGEDRWVYGGWIAVARFKARPAAIGSSERWVGVNLSQQTAVAYEGDQPVYAMMVATGLPKTPTVQGIFRTWWRIPWRKMVGGSAATGGFYYLEEVPWTCYFYDGYALHGAYWHDAFGRPRSHGCVNMSLYDSWWVFQWSAGSGANSPAVYVYWA